MKSIFLSYRIADSAFAVTEISKQMAARISRTHVFRDDDSIELGALYADRIRAALEDCETLVAIIGPHWLDATDGHGNRRIDNDQDWVRLEIRTAYERGVPVIPVLLDDTPLPSPGQLPADIRALAQSQFWTIRHRTLDTDISGLIDRLAPDSRPCADAGDTSAKDIHHTQINKADKGSNVITNNGRDQDVRIGHVRRWGR